VVPICIWTAITTATPGLEHIALRHQIGVLKRFAGKRPKLTAADRVFWVFLSRVWCDWRSALDIVKPATAIAWHHKGFRLFWTLEDPEWPGGSARCEWPERTAAGDMTASSEHWPIWVTAYPTRRWETFCAATALVRRRER
jgi:hypothetical protein